MKNYLNLIKKILIHGEDVPSRSGNVRTLTHQSLSFDLREGFPRLTERFVPFKSVAVELEGFIGGITSKKWYQDRNCKFWDSWGNPKKVKKRLLEHFKGKYGNTDPPRVEYFDTKNKFQIEENDLGPIYGWQWRNFNEVYNSDSGNSMKLVASDRSSDQLNSVVKKLSRDPSDRRMRVSSTNPSQQHLMALPACHDYFKVDVINGNLDLSAHLRSWDLYLGGPANIQSYSILAHLLAKTANLQVRKMTIFSSNVHLYENLIPQSEELLSRKSHPLPEIEITCNNIFKWTHNDIVCKNYKNSGKLSAEVSV